MSHTISIKIGDQLFPLSGCLRKGCVVEEGPYKGARPRTEFEAIGLLGPNCGISDFGAIVKANQLCDEIELDTTSAGNAVALTMELYEQGLIGKAYTDGIEARFGSTGELLSIYRAHRQPQGDWRSSGRRNVPGPQTEAGVESLHPRSKGHALRRA